MASNAQLAANRRYRKKVKQVNVPLFPRDEDIAAWLDGKSGKAQYIRDLIRADMHNNATNCN